MYTQFGSDHRYKFRNLKSWRWITFFQLKTWINEDTAASTVWFVLFFPILISGIMICWSFEILNLILQGMVSSSFVALVEHDCH